MLLSCNFFHVEDNRFSNFKTSCLVWPFDGLSFPMSLSPNVLPIPSTTFELALCAASKAVLIPKDIMYYMEQAACNMHDPW